MAIEQKVYLTMQDNHSDAKRKDYSHELVWEAAVRHARIPIYQQMVKRELPLYCSVLAKQEDIDYILSLPRPRIASTWTKSKRGLPI